MASATDSLNRQRALARAELARRELSRRGLLDYVCYTFPGYRVNWHHVEFAKRLNGWMHGYHTREIIEVPPRHGKTEMLARACAMLLGLNPDAEIIMGTYSAELAATFCRKVKQILAGEAHKLLFPASVVSNGRDGGVNQALEFTLMNGYGGMKCAGVGGGITGRGMTHGLIDDPVKGRQDGESDTIRARVWDWYLSDFMTRQQGNQGEASVVVVHTRWHEDDLIGKLLQTEPGRWHETKYPAINEAGEALWEDQVSLANLELMRSLMPARDWMSLYQQEPVPPGGDIFQADWLENRYATYDGEGDTFVDLGGKTYRDRDAIWYYTQDCAATERTHGDYTALATWSGIPGGELCLRRMDRVQLEAPKVIDLMKRRVAERPGVIYVEPNGLGLPIIQMARREGLAIKELDAHRDKVSRAEGVTPMMADGKFCLPHSAPWLGKLEKELLSFPNAAHDDQVDAIVYGLKVWQKMGQRRRALRQAQGDEPRRPSVFAGVQPSGGVGWAR